MFPVPCTYKAENVIPRSTKSEEKIEKKITKVSHETKVADGRCRCTFKRRSILADGIRGRDGLGARGVTISHNYRLATLTIRPTPVGPNRRQLSCISIRRGLRNIDFLPAIFTSKI